MYPYIYSGDSFWPLNASPHPTWLPLTILIVFRAMAHPDSTFMLRCRGLSYSCTSMRRKHKVLWFWKWLRHPRPTLNRARRNTLASVRALMTRCGRLWAGMLNHLIAYLRAAMPGTRRAPTMRQQGRTAKGRGLSRIMKIRFVSVCNLRRIADAAARALPTPPLSRDDLGGKCVEHAIESRKVQGGIIRLKAMIRRFCALQIEVQDHGRGRKRNWEMESVCMNFAGERLGSECTVVTAQRHCWRTELRDLTVTVSIQCEAVASNA